MKSKGIGVVIFPEDMERIAKRVKPQYQFAVVYALSRYAQTGDMPTEEELGEGGMIAFEFIRDKVDDAVSKYNSRRNAANSRWNEEDATECKTMQMNATECKPMQTDAKRDLHQFASKTETETETETVSETKTEADEVTKRARAKKTASAPAPVIGITGEDLSEDIRRNELADNMIKTYGLNDSIASRDALLDDLAAYGEAKMREVLKTAALSNSRGKISVAFYRAILSGSGAKKSAEKERSEYQHRQYSASDFKAMEVDLDAI